MKLIFLAFSIYVVFSYVLYQRMEKAYTDEKNTHLCQQIQVMKNEIEKRNQKEILFSERISSLEKASKKSTSFNWNTVIGDSDPILMRLRQD